jgi:phage-related protein
MGEASTKEVIFVASAQEDPRAFPDDVKQVMGFALYEAERGGKHPAAKPLKGFKGARVLEIVDELRRRHVSRCLHGQARGRVVCNARVPEEVQEGYRYSATRS